VIRRVGSCVRDDRCQKSDRVPVSGGDLSEKSTEVAFSRLDERLSSILGQK
jgi:hypothetical protein